MKKRHVVLLLTAVLFSLFFLSSCKKLMRSEIPEGERELPDIIMHGATYIFGQQDNEPLVMNAQTITMYTGKGGRTILEDVSFHQEDDGLEGSCDNAYVNEKNTVATLSGNIRLAKKSDEFEIECDDLKWDDEAHIITSDGYVFVTYEDGMKMKAIGFSAQLDDNIYEFGEIIEGRFTSED